MEKFSIKINRFKYFLTIFFVPIFGILAILVPFLEYERNGEHRLISFLITSFGVFMMWLFFKFIAMWKYKDEIISISNGALINRTSLLNSEKEIKLEDIDRVSKKRNGFKNIHEIVIYLKRGSHSNRKNSLITRFVNQIKGRDIYITDYLIKKSDLQVLRNYLISKMN